MGLDNGELFVASKRGKSPCYKCTERYMGCHGECEKYANYKDSVEVVKHEYAVVKNERWYNT